MQATIVQQSGNLRATRKFLRFPVRVVVVTRVPVELARLVRAVLLAMRPA